MAATEVVTAAANAVAHAPFRVGAKEIYLPSFSVTLLRSPRLPPNNARFSVPLWFSKLDLRDYLYHAYNVRVFAIRSYVRQSRVEQGDPFSELKSRRRWHRPRAKKEMTVELERPFVWPEEPESWAPWNKKEQEMAEEDQQAMMKTLQADADTHVNEGRRTSLREQAKELLEGKKRWKPMGNRQSVSMLTR